MLRRAWPALFCAVLVACAGSGSRLDGRDRMTTPRPARGVSSSAKPPAAPLVARRVAEVRAGTYGPYVGQRASGTILVWAEADAANKRAFYTLGLSAALAPIGKAQAVGPAPAELELVVVKPAGPNAQEGSAAAGFVVLFTHRDQEQYSVRALLLGPRGELVSGPTLLGRAPGEVLWVDALATSRGTLALWAKKRDDRADLMAVELPRPASKVATPLEIMRDVRAWQAQAVPGGVAIGAVSAAAEARDRGQVKAVLLDETGKLEKPPVLVNGEVSAELDFDMVRVAENLVLAWTDRRDVEARVYSAVLDGKVRLRRAPAPLTEPFGEQALVQLVSPYTAGAKAFAVWESFAERPASGRAFELATIDENAALSGPRGRLFFDAEDSTIPELKATKGGLAALTLAPACTKSKDCENAERLPTFVSFGERLQVQASEPMRLSALAGAPAPLAWGLSCADSGCFALSALATAPAPVFAVQLEPRSSVWRPAGAERVREAPPRVNAIQAVALLDPLADVSVARVDNSTLAAWVTYFEPSLPWARLSKPAIDGRFDPLRARLELRTFPEHAPPGKAQVISLRARSVGGVAIASGEPARKEALIGWSAVDNKEPQVFLTLVANDGRRIQQRMLTRRSGELSDIALAFVGDGFIVGWIDERHGDPEVYVTKVNRQLQRIAPERRLTNAKGAATGLSLLTRGERVVVVWADARDAEQPGLADIYLTHLRASDGAPLAVEQRVAETRAHSHSPALALQSGRAWLAWIENEPTTSSQKSQASVRVGALDDTGRLAEPDISVSALGGTPTALALDCTSSACRVVMSVEGVRGSELQACELAPTQSTPANKKAKVTRLITLGEASGQAVPPALYGAELFYADQAGPQQGRVRRMLIDWGS